MSGAVGDDRRAKVALALGAGALGAACLSLYLQHRRRSFAGHVSRGRWMKG
jgi:hypothetical protein